VTTHDSLFRHVVEGVLGEKPTRDKAPYLLELRDRGVFLVDLCEDPFASRREALPGCVAGLVARCRDIAPNRIVLISAGTYDHAYAELVAAGLPVVDARLPFPGSGQQRRFLEGFRLALEADGAGRTSRSGVEVARRRRRQEPPCLLDARSSPARSRRPSPWR